MVELYHVSNNEPILLRSQTLITCLSQLLHLSSDEIKKGLLKEQLQTITWLSLMDICHPEELIHFPNLKTLEIRIQKGANKEIPLNEMILPELPQLRELVIENVDSITTLDIQKVNHLFSLKVIHNANLTAIIGVDCLRNPVEIEIYDNPIKKAFDIQRMLSKNVVPNFILDLQYIPLFEKENAFFKQEIRAQTLAQSSIQWKELCLLSPAKTFDFTLAMNCHGRILQTLEVILQVNMSSIEKVCAIYSWLVENLRFDEQVVMRKEPMGNYQVRLVKPNKEETSSSSFYTAVMFQKTGAEGFCALLQYMLAVQGIFTRKVLCCIPLETNTNIKPIDGYVASSNCNHTILAIDTSNGWFYLDPTMDSILPDKKLFFYETKKEVLNRYFLQIEEQAYSSPDIAEGMYSKEKMARIFDSQKASLSEKDRDKKKKSHSFFKGFSRKKKDKKTSMKKETSLLEGSGYPNTIQPFYKDEMDNYEPINEGNRAISSINIENDIEDNTSSEDPIKVIPEGSHEIKTEEEKPSIIEEASVINDEEYKTIEDKLQYYQSLGFDMQRLRLIEEGLQAEVDISYFASLQLSAKQMRILLTGLEKGYDISAFSSESYDAEQMEALLFCLEQQYDISNLLDIKITSEEMIYQYLMDTLDAQYVNMQYSVDQFNKNQLKEIKYGVLKKLDVTKYLSPSFNVEQMQMIRRGLEKGIPVNRYNDPSLSVEEMMIRYYELLDKK